MDPFPVNRNLRQGCKCETLGILHKYICAALEGPMIVASMSDVLTKIRKCPNIASLYCDIWQGHLSPHQWGKLMSITPLLTQQATQSRHKHSKNRVFPAEQRHAPWPLLLFRRSILGQFFGVDFLSQSRLPGPVISSDWLSPPRLRILCCWRSWLRFYSWATMVGFFPDYSRADSLHCYSAFPLLLLNVTASSAFNPCGFEFNSRRE